MNFFAVNQSNNPLDLKSLEKNKYFSSFKYPVSTVPESDKNKTTYKCGMYDILKTREIYILPPFAN